MDIEGLREKLEELYQLGLYRRLRRMDTAPNRCVKVDQRELIMCASNNYLGLANDPRLMEAAVFAIRKYGAGSSGSRLTTGNTALHERLEQRIAEFKGTEAAIVFNSGYMANVAAMTALAGANDVIFSDELNHASLIDGCRLSKAKVVVYKHADVADLTKKLASECCLGERLIVTDGVFSMDGDIAPLPELVELAHRYDAWLVVDDAHGTGVLGTHGKGTSEHFGLSSREIPVQIGTLSKAVAGEGGYIAGSQVLIDYLRNVARPFIFSTALSPGVVGTVLKALDILEMDKTLRLRLREISKEVRTQLQMLGFRVLSGETPIIPVLIGDSRNAVGFSMGLEELGLFAPAIRPPSVPEGTSRIRLTLMATHTDDDVAKIIHSFATVGREMRVIP